MSNQSAGESRTLQTSMAKAIVILVISTLIMIAAGFANFKFTPIVGNFLQEYGLDMGGMGIIMSVFQWVCIIAMLPAGFMISKIVPRWSGVLGCACIILGNLVALLASSIAALVVGRIVEALGFCLLQVLTQSVVCAVFKGQKFLGTATGILNTGMMFGQMIHLNVAPRVAQVYGLNGVYTYIIVAIAVLAVLWLIVINADIMRMVDESNKTQKAQALTKTETKSKKWSVYKTPQIWLIAVGFSLVGGAVGRAGQYIPEYLSANRGLDSVEAAGLVSISTALGIVIFVVYGALADLLKTRRKLMIFSCLSVVAVYLTLMYLPMGMIMVFIVLYGTLPRAFTPLTYSCYPDLFDDGQLVPIAHSVVHFTGNVIGATLTVVFGFIIEHLGYDALWYFCIILGVAAAVCWYFAKKVK